MKTNLQVSEELTTSRGPGTCFQFSVSLVEQLFGESASMEIEKFLVRPASIAFFTIPSIDSWMVNMS